MRSGENAVLLCGPVGLLAQGLDALSRLALNFMNFTIPEGGLVAEQAGRTVVLEGKRDFVHPAVQVPDQASVSSTSLPPPVIDMT